MVLEIAGTVKDDVDVERHEDRYELVLELLGPAPETAAAAPAPAPGPAGATPPGGR
jgi:hypothetical protein